MGVADGTRVGFLVEGKIVALVDGLADTSENHATKTTTIILQENIRLEISY